MKAKSITKKFAAIKRRIKRLPIKHRKSLLEAMADIEAEYDKFSRMHLQLLTAYVGQITDNAIPPKDWQWYGYAGHLYVSADCLFHMTTVVGKYLVSTIGHYLPSENAELFETYVFFAGEMCHCGCTQPRFKGSEIYGVCCATAGKARENHLAACEEYASAEKQELTPPPDDD